MGYVNSLEDNPFNQGTAEVFNFVYEVPALKQKNMISRWIGWHEVPIGRQPQPLPALEDLLVFCPLQDVHFVGDNSSDALPCKFKMKPENHRWHLFEDEKTCANTLIFQFNMLVFWGLLRVYK